MKVFLSILILYTTFGFGQATPYAQTLVVAYNAALEAQKKGETDQALSLVNEAISIDSTCFEAHYLAACLWYEKFEFSKSLAAATKANSCRAFDKEVIGLIGKNDYQLGNFELAEKHLKKACSLGDDRLTTYFFLALTLRDLSKFTESLFYFEKILTASPSTATYWLNRGLLYSAMNMHEKALTDFELALKNNQSLVVAHIEAAKTCNLLGKSDEALEHIETGLSLAIGGDRLQLLLLKGDYYRKIGDYSSTAIHYTAAFEQDSLNPIVLTYQSALLIDLEQYNEAISKCNKALEIDETLAAAYLNRGIALEMIRQVDAACESWQQAFILGSINAVEYLNSPVCNE